MISVSTTDLRVGGAFREIAPRTRLMCCGAGITVTSTKALRHTPRSLTIDFHDASPSGVIKSFLYLVSLPKQFGVVCGDVL